MAVPELIPEKELARRLGRSLAALRRWRRIGWAPTHYRVGGAIMYRWPDVQTWLEARRG